LSLGSEKTALSVTPEGEFRFIFNSLSRANEEHHDQARRRTSEDAVALLSRCLPGRAKPRPDRSSARDLIEEGGLNGHTKNLFGKSRRNLQADGEFSGHKPRPLRPDTRRMWDSLSGRNRPASAELLRVRPLLEGMISHPNLTSLQGGDAARLAAKDPDLVTQRRPSVQHVGTY